MSVQISTLIEAVQIASAPTVYFTAAAPTRVDKVTVTNVTADARQVSLFMVPAGVAPLATNTIVLNRVLQPGESWDVQPLMGQVLTRGDQIAASCDSAAAVNLFASGTVVS